MARPGRAGGVTWEAERRDPRPWADAGQGRRTHLTPDRAAPVVDREPGGRECGGAGVPGGCRSGLHGAQEPGLEPDQPAGGTPVDGRCPPSWFFGWWRVTLGAVLLLDAGMWAPAIGTLAGAGMSATVILTASPARPRPGWDRRAAASALGFGMPMATTLVVELGLLNVDYLVVGNRAARGSPCCCKWCGWWSSRRPSSSAPDSTAPRRRRRPRPGRARGRPPAPRPRRSPARRRRTGLVTQPRPTRGRGRRRPGRGRHRGDPSRRLLGPAHRGRSARQSHLCRHRAPALAERPALVRPRRGGWQFTPARRGAAGQLRRPSGRRP